MTEKVIHYGVPYLSGFGDPKGWKIVAKCGNIVKGDKGPRLGDFTDDLRLVTCPDCQEANAFKALVEFT